MIQKIEIHHQTSDFDSYRAARVKSLFNAESGCNFDLTIENVDLSGDWNIGVIVGASGSGKTSIGKQLSAPLMVNWLVIWLFRRGSMLVVIERPDL